MSLSTDKIKAIRDGIDIVNVIGARVALKKKGQRHLGLCPFHSEKTPSFSVSAAKGLYYCFGCHAGGDVFSFLMRHQGIDFVTAARLLAKEAGVELEPESDKEKRRRKTLDEIGRINEYAQAFFEHALFEDVGEPAREYLSSREIPESFARDRRLGFGGRPGALLAYLEAKKVPSGLVGRAGMLSEDGKRGLFDGRLTFPIFDASGRLAGFSGRRIGDGPSAKYINSRETPLFAKRKLLYGWDVAQEAIRRTGRVVVVEGQTDVLACQRAGLAETVAALGTAFSDDHARTCARLAKDAVILFDGDAAGLAASREATQRFVAAKLKTSVAPLAAGQDPASLMHEKGAGALKAVMGNAVPAIEHFIDVAFQEHTLSIEDRAAAAGELAPLLAALSSGLERDLYTARLAEKVGVTIEQLQEHLRAARGAKRKGAQAPSRAPSDADAPQAPRAVPDAFELNMLLELFLYPELRPRFGELAEFSSDLMRVVLEDLAGSDDPVVEILGRHISDSRINERLATVQPADPAPGDDPTERARRTFNDVLSRLKARHMQATKQLVQRELQEAEARDEGSEETAELRERLKTLTRRQRELKRPGSTA